MRTICHCLGLILSCSLHAASCKITWEPCFGSGINYRVVKWVDNKPVSMGETAKTELVVDLNTDDQVSVISFNELGEAKPSTPITIKPKKHKIILQKSNDLKSWETKIIYLDEDPTAFFRLQIETE